MLNRRSTAVVAVLLPLTGALTSCGFDYPTDRVNTIAAGVNNREASVDVLGARVLAFADGQGRLIGTLVYNDNDAEKPAVLTGIEGDAIAPTQAKVEVGPNERVNLAEDASVAVTGEFAAGEVITLSYQFSTDEVVTVDVPVVKACGQYADIEEPEFEAVAEDEEAPAGDAEAEAEEAFDEEADATYLCDHPTEHAEGEH
ncbi:hypothetical protein [Nocardioides stalactiti]|uniref:hypothetical protein n=1 Tax=Nocardioides stalactiti TaxID=2755356 RepID=UPI0015FF034D|nr:hypothetical protein [Nocardioides stalactiti]